MAVENLCAHEECIGWCQRKIHTIYGTEHGMPSVEQHGNLYTMDGMKYPHEVQPEIRDRVRVPDKFRHLLEDESTSENLMPDLDLDALAELDELGVPDEEEYETVSKGRGVNQRQPKTDNTPRKIGR